MKSPAPDAIEAAPRPLLSSRQPYAIASLALASLSVGLFLLWTLSSDGLLGESAWTAVGVLSFALAGAGVILSIVGLVKREWPAALLALLVSIAAATPAAPFVFLLVLASAVGD